MFEDARLEAQDCNPNPLAESKREGFANPGRRLGRAKAICDILEYVAALDVSLAQGARC